MLLKGTHKMLAAPSMSELTATRWTRVEKETRPEIGSPSGENSAHAVTREGRADAITELEKLATKA